MGNGQKKPDLLDVSMELKMTARQMERESQKLEQQEKAERKKIVDVRIQTIIKKEVIIFIVLCLKFITFFV